MEKNTSLSARIRRRNKANGGKLGEGNHSLFFPKEHYGSLPPKRIPAMVYNKKKKCYEVRKRKDGSIIYEVSPTAHILRMAQKLGVVTGKHAGSKPIRRLALACGRVGEALGHSSQA